MTDKDVVRAFVAHLRKAGETGLEPLCFPDEDNRSSRDIDGTAGTFAIEHTSVDTVANQRRDGAWFSAVADPLEAAFKGLPFRIEFVFPYDGLAKDRQWRVIRDALSEWLNTQSGHLTDGRHDLSLVGVPFVITVLKSSDPRRRLGLWCARFTPEDDDLPGVAVQIVRKTEKLAPYKAKGFTTTLLVESGDVALMSTSKMREAVNKGLNGVLPAGLDQLWYVETSAGIEYIAFEQFFV